MVFLMSVYVFCADTQPPPPHTHTTLSHFPWSTHSPTTWRICLFYKWPYLWMLVWICVPYDLNKKSLHCYKYSSSCSSKIISSLNPQWKEIHRCSVSLSSVISTCTDLSRGSQGSRPRCPSLLLRPWINTGWCMGVRVHQQHTCTHTHARTASCRLLWHN